MAMIETTETPEDVERLLTKAREQLQAFEDAVDNKRLLARVKRSNPAHWVLLARAGFFMMGALFFVLVFVIIGLAFFHNPSARVLEGIQQGLGIPGGVPVAALAVSLSMFVGHLAMTFLAHNIGRNSPMLPWEAKEHQKLVNEVTRLTTQKAVMERIRQTPGGARPRISTPVPMSMRSKGPGALGGRGGFGGASMPPYAAGASQPSSGGGGGFGQRAPSVPPYAASQPPAGGFGTSPASSFGGGGNQSGFGGNQGGGNPGGGFGGGASQGGGFRGGPSAGFSGAPQGGPPSFGGSASGPNFGGGGSPSGGFGGRPPSGGFGAPDAYGGDDAPASGGGGLLGRARAGGSGPNFGSEPSGFQGARSPSNPPGGFSGGGGGGFGQRAPSDPGFASAGGAGFGQRPPSDPGYGSAGFGGSPSGFAQPSGGQSGFGQPSGRQSGFGQPSGGQSGFGQPSGGQSGFGQPSGGQSGFGQQSRGFSGGNGSGFGQGSSGFSGPGEATFEESRPSAGVRLGAATRGGTPLGAKPRAGGGLGTPRLAAPMGFPGTPEPPPRRVEYDVDYEDDEEEVPEPVGDAPARIGIQMGVKKARKPAPDPGIALDVGDIVETMAARPSFVSEDAPTQPMESRERGLPHWGRIDDMWLEEAVEKAEAMVLSFPEQALLEFSTEPHLPFTLVIERATPAMAVRAMVAYVEFLASICTPPRARIRLVNVAHLDRSFHRNVDAALQPYFAGQVRVENNPGQVDIIFSEPDPNWEAYPDLPING